MLRWTFACCVMVLLLYTLGKHQALGQHFQMPSYTGDIQQIHHRCRKEDILPTNELVQQRLAWAKACQVVPDEFLFNARYDAGNEAIGEPEKIDKTLYLFPSFTYTKIPRGVGLADNLPSNDPCSLRK